MRSPACLDSTEKEGEEEEEGGGCPGPDHPAPVHICAGEPDGRVLHLLRHPAFPSRCWDSAPGTCPPPVLEPVGLARLTGNDTAACRAVAARVLCSIATVNRRLVRMETVLDSGFCTGTGTCSNFNNNAAKATRCRNCQKCKVTQPPRL
mgnify:CR=1 FL=1